MLFNPTNSAFTSAPQMRDDTGASWILRGWVSIHGWTVGNAHLLLLLAFSSAPIATTHTHTHPSLPCAPTEKHFPLTMHSLQAVLVLYHNPWHQCRWKNQSGLYCRKMMHCTEGLAAPVLHNFTDSDGSRFARCYTVIWKLSSCKVKLKWRLWSRQRVRWG